MAESIRSFTGRKMAGTMRLLFFSVVFFLLVFTQLTKARFNIPAIIVFGDSTADVGDNNFLPGNQAKANFPHNGIDFPGGTPTGRFSNGYNSIDFLGMPPLILFLAGKSET